MSTVCAAVIGFEISHDIFHRVFTAAIPKDLIHAIYIYIYVVYTGLYYTYVKLL